MTTTHGLVAFACLLFLDKSIANDRIECRGIDSDALLNMPISASSKTVRLKNKSEICELGFEFIPSSTNPLVGLIRTAPQELGLNAQNEVFRISFESGSSSMVGELPASAELASENRFTNIIQQGFSIHQTTYIIQGDSVTISPDSLELVVGGTVCTDLADRAYVREIASNRDCKAFTKSSYKKPVCLVHHATTTKVSPLDRCTALLEPNIEASH